MLKKISVVGNSCAGKTTLCRSLAQIHSLPLTHVDSIQFVAGMKIRPHSESIQILNAIQDQDTWIIDGYGPLDIIEKRFELADRIVFIDFPLWRHYAWAVKRQFSNLWSQRKELPEDCNELSYVHITKLFKTIFRVHQKMRPQILKMFQSEKLKHKVIWVKDLKTWNQLANQGL